LALHVIFQITILDKWVTKFVNFEFIAITLKLILWQQYFEVVVLDDPATIKETIEFVNKFLPELDVVITLDL